jgi:hypothetical protein
MGIWATTLAAATSISDLADRKISSAPAKGGIVDK